MSPLPDYKVFNNGANCEDDLAGSTCTYGYLERADTTEARNAGNE